MTTHAAGQLRPAVRPSPTAGPPSTAPRPAGPGRASAWVARHRIGVFLVIAFSFSWWPWPIALFQTGSTAMVSFGPIIAAVLVTAVAGGRGQLVTLLAAVGRWRVPWSRYMIVLAGPFLIVAAAAAAAVVLGVESSASVTDGFGWSAWSTVPLLLITTALLGGPLFEEVGWRGYLLPQLQQRRTALAATATVALVWAGWHLPLLISDPTGQRPPLPFLVWILAQAVLLSWIINISSGSVLMAILFHTTANVSGRMLLEPYLGQDGFVTVWWLLAAAYGLTAALVLCRTRGRLGLAAPRQETHDRKGK